MDSWRRARARIVRSLEWLVIVMVVALTLTVLWGVFTRFVLGHQAQYTDELARVLLVWVSMIGAALAFGSRSHLGVDYLVTRLDPAAARIVALAVHAIVIVLAAVVFVAGGWGLAMGQMEQALPTLRPLTRGMVYLAVPLSGVFIIVFTIGHLAATLSKSDGLDAGPAVPKG